MLLQNISRDTLLKPLQAVAGIVERRHTLAILSNVLMSVKDHKLSFTATDLEIQITASESVNAENFAITTNARKLLDLLRALPEQALLSLELKDNRLLVRTGKSRYQLQTLSAEEFPALKLESDPEVSINITQAVLKQLIHLVDFSMAQQDVRFYLNGMLFKVENAELITVATDGHRLSFAQAVVENAELPKKEIVLPRKTVLELVKLLKDSDETIAIAFYVNQISFAFNDIQLVSKVIDGKFPDYLRVIPTHNQHKILIGRTLLQQTLGRVAILANEKFRGVRLIAGDNALKIISTNAEQEEAEEELEIDYLGSPLDVGFNISYLLDVLGNLNVNEIEIAFGDSLASTLITSPDQKNFKYVVMPIRI